MQSRWYFFIHIRLKVTNTDQLYRTTICVLVFKPSKQQQKQCLHYTMYTFSITAIDITLHF